MFAVAAAVLLLDQLSKAAVMHNLQPEVPWNPIVPLQHIFSLTYVTNTGTAFGLFPGLGNLLVFIDLAIVVGLLIFYRSFATSHWLMKISLGMQLGGAMGNVIDRLRFGRVIDFLDFKFWPVFNVADSCIVVGVLILAILVLRTTPEEQASAAGPGES